MLIDRAKTGLASEETPASTLMSFTRSAIYLEFSQHFHQSPLPTPVLPIHLTKTEVISKSLTLNRNRLTLSPNTSTLLIHSPVIAVTLPSSHPFILLHHLGESLLPQPRRRLPTHSRRGTRYRRDGQLDPST